MKITKIGFGFYQLFYFLVIGVLGGLVFLKLAFEFFANRQYILGLVFTIIVLFNLFLQLQAILNNKILVDDTSLQVSICGYKVYFNGLSNGNIFSIKTNFVLELSEIDRVFSGKIGELINYLEKEIKGIENYLVSNHVSEEEDKILKDQYANYVSILNCVIKEFDTPKDKKVGSILIIMKSKDNQLFTTTAFGKKGTDKLIEELKTKGIKVHCF